MDGKSTKQKEKKHSQKVLGLGRIHQVVGKTVIIELESANLPPMDSLVLLPDGNSIGPIVDFIGSVRHPWAVAVNRSGRSVTLGTKVQVQVARKKKSLKAVRRKGKGKGKGKGKEKEKRDRRKRRAR